MSAGGFRGLGAHLTYYYPLTCICQVLVLDNTRFDSGGTVPPGRVEPQRSTFVGVASFENASIRESEITILRAFPVLFLVKQT